MEWDINSSCSLEPLEPQPERSGHQTLVSRLLTGVFPSAFWCAPGFYGHHLMPKCLWVYLWFIITPFCSSLGPPSALQHAQWSTSGF